jgi:hypothetical protein
MKRSELYAKVWEVPLSKLGPALGLSDVGLRKLCQRNSIPVPPAGYWAKRLAGKAVRTPPLPRTSSDDEISLPTSRQIERNAAAGLAAKERLKTRRDAMQAVDRPNIRMVETLDHCHPLVRRTAKFFHGIKPAIDKEAREAASAQRRGEPRLSWMRVPRTVCGRYSPDESGCLRIAATLHAIDWILRFHESLLRGLISSGLKVKVGGASASTWIEVRGNGEAVRLSFSEEYDKIPKRAGKSDVWSILSKWEYKRRDSFKLKMERDIGALKQWVGNAEKLESLLPEIVREFDIALRSQGQQRKVLAAKAAEQKIRDERHAEERRLWFAAEEAKGKRAAARKAQIGRAKEVAHRHEEHQLLVRFLLEFESRLAHSSEDDGLRVWLNLVRMSASNPLDVLMSNLREECSKGGSPEWWPEDASKADWHE